MEAAPARTRPQAVLFDAYGTLFDVYGVAQLAERCFPGHGERIAALWRDKQIEYTRLTSMSADADGHVGGCYQPLWALTAAALRYATARLGLALDADTEARLMAVYRELPAYPEVPAVLRALRARGLRTGILSNGDPPMLDAAVDAAGVRPLLDVVLSVHPLRRFKTDPAAYALGPQALGLPAREILFVSSNGWDALAATWYGYTTLWVNRAGAPPETLPPGPTHTGRSLHDVLPLFTDTTETPP